MIVQLPTIVVDANPANLEEMADFLSRLGVDVVARHARLGEVDITPGPRAPQLLVVNLDPDPHASLDALASLMQHAPDLAVWVMSEATDPQLLMEAMHLGVREFISVPAQPDRLPDGVEFPDRGQ